MRLLGVLGFFMLSVPYIGVEAQSSSPSGFYQNNYAQAPQVDGQPLSPPRPASHDSQSPSGVPVDVRGPMVGKPPINALSQGQSAPSGAPQKSVGVMLYVSSQDKAHFESMIKEALKVQDRNAHIRVLGVYHIGDYRNVEPWVSDELKKRGIYFSALHQVPPQWNVKTSPLWVLGNIQEEHLIEGPIPIEKCVDKDGKYREPEASMFAAPPTPTGGVKEF